MKKLLIITLLFASFLTSAQQANSWVFTGEMSFLSEKTETLNSFSNNSENSQTRLLGSVGYVLAKSNLELGLSIGYDRSDLVSFLSENNDKLVSINFAPYIKKYFILNDKFALHLKGALAFGKGYIESDMSNDEFDLNQVGFIIRPGFVYFLTNKIGLIGNIGSLAYISSTTKFRTGSDSKSKTFGFNLNGSNISLGIAFYL
ncbi:hypothetical protein [uncultured Polaribacter sp.]|uniref:hypothetical protein n=1 Tax=uncultured Polaribacter sp. TaxID=174711 RepID=UPI002609807A|nr:hypothetical protein [uncultured Polaribacter sp.]